MSIDLKNISVIYNKGTILERVVLQDTSLSLQQGQFIALIGNNGAGKSTVARIIAGESQVSSGSVIIDGRDCTKEAAYERANLISRVFQDPAKGTAPNLTVLENLVFASKRGLTRSLALATKKEAREYFFDKLQSLKTGLENKLDSPVFMLSGGQRQLLSLFMAVSMPAKILLLDEHTAALDPEAAKFVMRFTHKILKDYNITTIMITHDMRELEYCDDVYAIYSHKIAKVER